MQNDFKLACNSRFMFKFCTQKLYILISTAKSTQFFKNELQKSKIAQSME